MAKSKPKRIPKPDGEAKTAATVLVALRNGPLKTAAHAWLYEVRNHSGYTRRVRFADAVVTSLWPSRGLWIAGIEVKVFRNDWLRELKDFTKTADIQKHCDYWWIAAPPDVVKVEELPEAWGLYVVEGKSVKVAKQAPKLKTEPLDLTFVASMLRRAADGVEHARQQGHNEAWQKASSELDGAAVSELKSKIYELEREKDALARQVEFAKRDRDNALETIREFEKAAGLEQYTLSCGTGAYRQAHDVGTFYRLARLLSELDSHRIAEKLEGIAKEIQALTKARDDLLPPAELKLVNPR